MRFRVPSKDTLEASPPPEKPTEDPRKTRLRPRGGDPRGERSNFSPADTIDTSAPCAPPNMT